MRTFSSTRRVATFLSVAATAVAAVCLGTAATAGAATCDGADFTYNGQFDMEGYLACLSGTYAPPPDGVTVEWPTNDAGQSYIEPGQTSTITMCCFTPGSEFTATIDTGTAAMSAQAVVTVGPYTVAADGSVAVELPALPAGNYQMVVKVDGKTFAVPLLVGVVIPAAGSNSLPMLGIALGLVVVGAGAVGASVRKRRSATATVHHDTVAA